MKKIILTALFIVFAMMLGACGASGGAGDDAAAKADAAAGKAKTVSTEEFNEALELYACQILDIVRSSPSPDLVPAVEEDDSVALCDLNNDGLPELLAFHYSKLNSDGSKTLKIYTIKDGAPTETEYALPTFDNLNVAGRFDFENVSWGPSYLIYIDAKGMPCIEAEQGGATSGTYLLHAWRFDKNCFPEEMQSMLINVSDDADPAVKLGNWNIESADCIECAVEPEVSDGGYTFVQRIDPIRETDSEKCAAKYTERMQGIQKVIFYYGDYDSYCSEELLDEADANGMTYQEFLDYVSEQTDKTYDELVDKSFEFFPI